MRRHARLLILGGTTEAAVLARATAAQFGEAVEIITSLAGRLNTLPLLPGRLRIGGFGGAEGLASYLRKEGIDFVIDSTHPFAVQISAHAAAACTGMGVPRLVLVRPPWRPEPGDHWIEVAGFAEAAGLVPCLAERVFLTTGPGELAAFAGVTGVHFLVRMFELPPTLLPLCDYEVIVARPPFSLASETLLMDKHQIGALVAKNSGGPTSAKLAAARNLGLPVVMIARPTKPDGTFVPTAEGALSRFGSWLTAA